MASSQTQSNVLRGRAGFALLAGLSTLGGAGAMVHPFVVPAGAWEWRLRSEADLAGATVNADHEWASPDGIILRRRGSREISLITAPLRLSGDTGSTIRISAWMAEDEFERRRLGTTIRLLWQTNAGESFQFETREIDLELRPQEFEFSLPVAPESVHRMGVQFPGMGEVRIESIAAPALSPIERAGAALRQFCDSEPFGNHTINFLRGPSILGHGLNYYVVSFWAASIGLYGLCRWARRRPINYRVAGGFLILGWFAVDAAATLQLTRQARADVENFGGQSWRQQIIAMSGWEISWTHQKLLENCPAGGRYAVLSDDPFTPSRRLDYLLAPRRTRTDDPDQADWMVMIHESRAWYSPDEGLLHLPDGRSIAASKVASKSPDVFLLRRIGR